MSLISSNQPYYNYDGELQLDAPAPSKFYSTAYASDDESQTTEQTMRIFSKANESYSLTVKNGEVLLAPANPRDLKQHWIKDMEYGKDVKDAQGLPSFALINKGTGQAMQHPSGPGKPVRMVPFNPKIFDKSILWSESHDLGDTFKCIRMAENIHLNQIACHGRDENGVQEGATIKLCEGFKGKNQRWRIAHY